MRTGVAVPDHPLTSDDVDEHGQPRQFRGATYPVRDGAGGVLGVGFIAYEVTQQSRLKEQFRQAQKLEAVGRLAGGIAHDFDHLLTVIRSYCDLLMMEAGPDGASEELREIGGAADRAALLARQLLAFSSKQVIVPRDIDVNDIVGGIESMIQRLIPAHITLDSRLKSPIGAVRADPTHIEQILMNLVLNAVDAMPTGGRLVIATTDAVLDEEYAKTHIGVVPGEYVMFSVSDTGTGMDAATQQRMFEPFFTTKAEGKGTGLGLATVYGIVRQLSGHIWLYSELSEGTTFKIYLPRSHHAAEQVAAAAEPTDTNGAETILLVEDEDAVRASLTRILERQGYHVLGAAHGGEAMRIAREYDGDIHLVISDLMMPEMAGREFIERFGLARGLTRVLFMSGFSDDEVVTRGLVSDHQAFTRKPFTVADMSRTVRALLDGPPPIRR